MTEEKPPSLRTLQDWISDRSVALLLSPASGGLYVGSSVGIEICGRYFLATAAHNFNGISGREQIRALPGGRRLERPLYLLDWNLMNGGPGRKIDVAWVEIETVSAASSSAYFITVANILCGAQHREDTAFFVHGYPRDAVDRDDVVEETPLLTATGLGTNSVEPTAAACRFQDGIDLVVKWPPPDLGPHEAELGEPWGVSGGGIWLIPRYAENPQWSTADLRLGAINRSWIQEARQLFATRIEHWLRLLREDRAYTQKEIDPLLEGL